MTLKDAKDTIIQQSINSAIYIDDEVSEPYSGEDAEVIKNARDMYQSFRKEGLCDLDIYKFTSLDDFNDNREWLLNHKNLLILDWELRQNAQVKFEDTLGILDEIIRAKSARFVVVYTRAGDTSFVISQIKYAFSSIKRSSENYANFLADLEAELVDAECELSLDEIKKKVIDILTKNIFEEKERNKELCAYIRDNNIEKGIFDSLATKYGFTDYKELLLWAEIEELSEYKKEYSLSECEVLDDSTINVGDVIVYVIKNTNGPEGVAPEHLYNCIKDKIAKVKNFRSLLLSLYFRNVLLNQASTIGRGLENIDDSVLQYFASKYRENKKQNIPENIPALYSFVQECIMEEISTLLSNKSDDYLTPLLWDEKEHKDYKDIDGVKLNSFLSFIPEERLRSQKRQISTGDVFEVLTEGVTSGYLMCVTQGCDCVRPDKIEFNYAFSLGTSTTGKSALEGAEKRYYTYMPDGSLCIEWDRKFYTIHLENKEQRIFNTQELIVIDAITSLRYLGTQKDHYAQRVINNVFSTAMRMGADLVTREKNT